mmetsp:Transcript_26159/g.48796  ORF Transcript_26159/g.48796 Transcript_26159/m.48796 type:complete len:84 (-) Transcript_26159:1383-1634(-)
MLRKSISSEDPHFFPNSSGLLSPYFRRRSGALEGMFVASFVGVCSGVYIFKPLLDEIAANQAERKRREALEAASVSNNEGAEK